MHSAFARWNHVNGSLLCLEWDGRQKAPCGDCRKASKGAARAVGLTELCALQVIVHGLGTVRVGLSLTLDPNQGGAVAEWVRASTGRSMVRVPLR